jgi:hypothetical protein
MRRAAAVLGACAAAAAAWAGTHEVGCPPGAVLGQVGNLQPVEEVAARFGLGDYYRCFEVVDGRIVSAPAGVVWNDDRPGQGPEAASESENSTAPDRGTSVTRPRDRTRIDYNE